MEQERAKDYCFPDDLLELILDWRKPLIEGPGPEETESMPHEYQAMSLLGVVLRHRPRGAKKIRRIYIPILSKNRDHNSYAVGCHLDKMFDEVFENPTLLMFFLEKKRLEVRFDNASHFLSKEFLHYICAELPEREIFADFIEFSW